MSDSPETSTAPDGADPLAFAAVPVRARHDGWTPERQRGFVAALARIGLVSAAAKSVGKSAKSAYALRARVDAEGFAAAWDRAVAQGGRLVRDVGIERAIEGVLQPVFYRGRQVGARRVFDTRLLLAALRVAGPVDASPAWSLTWKV